MRPIENRFDQLEKKLKEPRFRDGRGLANEVKYYIFDYPAEEELYVRERVEYIRKKNEISGDPFKIVVFDLYDITIELLKEKGYLEKCFDFEAKKGFSKVQVTVEKFLRVNDTNGLIIKYIKERLPENAIVFVTGIGKCYPIIRAHTVLNNLHLVIDEVPVVLFYPGKYSGQELILFSDIMDDNYYRAFSAVD